MRVCVTQCAAGDHSFSISCIGATNAASNVIMRVVFVTLGLLFTSVASAATLEQLSIEQMTQKATTIVRGRVTGCAGELRGSVIYTRCGLAVSETWKGVAGARLEFLVLGGTAQGLSQTFSGAPKFNANEEFVFFLWTGKSGVPQIIGLSQGVFGVTVSKAGQATARREATSELMLDSAGNPVRDEAVSVPVNELRSRVMKALAGGRQP